MNEESDRRQSMRHDVRVRCQAVRERDFKLLGETSLDLSSDGMLLRTALPVLTGDNVIVSFLEPSESRWYDAEATVARVLHGRRPDDVGRCVALEFHSLDAETRARVRAALAASVPQRTGAGRVGASDPWSMDFGCDAPDDAYGTFALVM